MIIYLIFDQNWNFLATHVDARSQKWWFFTFFSRKQPIRRELANSPLKAKIQMKQIGGFTKSLSEYGRVWTWIAYFLKLIPNMNMKISISRIFENVNFFLLNPHRAFACMRGGWRGSRLDVFSDFSSFLASKSYQNINFDQVKDRDINLVIIYLIFDRNWNFLTTHVDARSQKWWFFTLFGRKQPMRRELANSPLKAKIQIKQIGGVTKSLSEYGRVWTWIAYFLKLIPIMNLKISISRIFENVNFFLLNPHRAFACMRGGWRGSRVDVFSSFLASKSYQNINFDQIKDRDINLVIIYLIFDQNWNFLATHVDARSQKWWFFTFFGRKQPMRRELANSPLKAKIQIKQIGGFTKSLSKYGRVWTWIAYFLKLIPNMNLKISISRIFENVNVFLLNPHRAFACMRGGWRGSRVDVFSSFLASKSYQNINFDQIKDRDINLVIIYLIFDQNWNFLATRVDARSQKLWFFTFFGIKQPMRRELANSPLKAKIQIKQIGGFTKSLSEYGRVWTRIAYFLKLIPNMNLKISISRIFENVIFFLLNPHRGFECMRGGWRGSRVDVFSSFWPQKATRISISIKLKSGT